MPALPPFITKREGSQRVAAVPRMASAPHRGQTKDENNGRSLAAA